jgi:hypothetical protein
MANYDSGAHYDDPNAFYDEASAPLIPMDTNKISAVISPTQQTAVLTAVDNMELNLPFLRGLTDEERKRMAKAANGRLPFIDKALLYAQQNPGVLPGDFSLPEFLKDVTLVHAYAPITARLVPFAEKVKDTGILMNSESYAQALLVYDCFKRANRNGAYGGILADLGAFFKGQGPQNPPPAPTP